MEKSGFGNVTESSFTIFLKVRVLKVLKNICAVLLIKRNLTQLGEIFSYLLQNFILCAANLLFSIRFP